MGAAAGGPVASRDAAAGRTDCAAAAGRTLTSPAAAAGGTGAAAGGPVASPAAVLAAARALRAVLTGFDPRLLAGTDCARVAEELAATEKACSSARLLSAARAVTTGAHRQAGFRDGASWLARQSGVTGQQAKRDLETAGRLADCPQTREALISGQISMAQAGEITRAEAQTPGVEQALVAVAKDTDLTRLRDRAREERQSRTPARDLHARQRLARTFRHWRDALGMVCFSGQLPPEAGVPLIARLERETERIRRAARTAAPGTAPEKWEAHAADALVALCSASGETKRSPRNELVIVCDLRTWRRDHTHPGEPCHIIGGGPIPVELAKELSADAFVKAVLHDGTAIHTVRHFGRHLPAELRTALDLGAVPDFTGRRCAECGGRWGLEYDHKDPVSNDGPTSYDNLQALCWPDHRAKTERDRQAGLTGRRGAPRPDPGPTAPAPSLIAPPPTAPTLTAPTGTAPTLTAPTGTAPSLTAPTGTAPTLTAPAGTPTAGPPGRAHDRRRPHDPDERAAGPAP